MGIRSSILVGRLRHSQIFPSAEISWSKGPFCCSWNHFAVPESFHWFYHCWLGVFGFHFLFFPPDLGRLIGYLLFCRVETLNQPDMGICWFQDMLLACFLQHSPRMQSMDISTQDVWTLFMHQGCIGGDQGFPRIIFPLRIMSIYGSSMS